MGNVQAQCLDYGLALLKIKNIILVNIGSKQLSCLLQLQNFVHRFGDLFLGIGDIRKIQYSSFDGVRILDAFCHQRLYQWDHIIHNIIYDMNGTTVHIHNDIIAVALILVYHSFIPLLSTSYCLRCININYSEPHSQNRPPDFPFAHVVTSPYFARRIFLRMQASDEEYAVKFGSE